MRLLPRTTALGIYDHGYVTALERGPTARTEGRLWHIRARRIVLATGATERPIVFANGDRPGIMLANAASAYLRRFAVRPGERAVIFTTNDTTDAVATDLAAGGIELVATVDARRGEVVVDTVADDVGRLAGVTIARLEDDGAVDPATARTVAADLLLVSGGWNPNVALWSQARGSLRFDERLAAFVPDRPFGPVEAVGACAGDIAGIGELVPLWVVPPLPVVDRPATDDDWAAHYLDLQRDATVRDLRRALGAGLTSIEHVKRYTTIGTAADQGKTSGVLASAIAASLLGQDVGAVGVPTFRPPYVPVSFAQLAGRDRGPLIDPVRTTSIQAWHVANGAVFEDVGQWQRPRYFPRDGESMDAAVLRECRTAREGVAAMDASTLGKIDLQGPDVGIFLDRVYTNAFAKLAVGSCRYGLMCRADGMVFDDGVTSRLADDRFHMTTTTGNAAPVLDWLEEWLQTEWPELRVQATSVTEQWATVAVVGPRSRDVLRALAPDLALEPEAFPFMTWRDAVVAGIAARIFRISFSGELAYEINVPTWSGLALWEAVMAAGAAHGIAPYGTETMHVLRAEKGYPIVGQETDGTVTPQDLGMGWIVSEIEAVHRQPLAPPARRAATGSQAARGPPADRPGRAPARGRPAGGGRCPARRSAGADDRPRDLELSQRRPRPDLRPGHGPRGPGADRPDGPRAAGRPDGRRHDRRAGRLRPRQPAPRRGRPMTGAGGRPAQPARGVRRGVRAGRDHDERCRQPGRAAVPGPARPAGRPRGRGAPGPPRRRRRGRPADRPQRAVATSGGERHVLWLGPDEWLVIDRPGTEASLEGRLRAALQGGRGSVVDVSANRTTIRLAGPAARESPRGRLLDRPPSARLRTRPLRPDPARPRRRDPAGGLVRARVPDPGPAVVRGLPRDVAARRHRRPDLTA